MLLKESLRSLVPRRLRRAARAVIGCPVPDSVHAWRQLGLHWEVEQIEFEEERLTACGWMIAPAHDDLELTANGHPLRVFSYANRPDIEAEHPLLAAEPGIRIRGFSAGVEDFGDTGWVKLEVESEGHPAGTVYWGCPADTGLSWPEEERRERIHGQADLAKFRVAGATAFAQLREGLRAITGLDYTNLPDVLDFGCGCGRTTRYFADLPVRLAGIDVLSSNISWLKQQMPFGRFETIPQAPPTSLPSAAFDLAIGVSTFTYLTEDRQFEWLSELRRVVRPGGYLLMTVQGETAFVLGRASLSQYRRLLCDGIVDRLEEGPDGYLAELGDYRGTFHHHDYLRREWSRYFEVLAVLPCQVGLQDLVVLRRPTLD